MRKFALILLVSLFVVGCKNSTGTNPVAPVLDTQTVNKIEQYRPLFHFTPEANWMNDPNGLVYHDGKYHLFYQYYPDGTVWGPMHWGHTVSSDLLQWERKPIALYPDQHGYIFSGSAVIDKHNTAGFGDNAMVAIFTYHNPDVEKEGSVLYQTQGIAYSTDGGESWTKYENNPVLDNPGIRDFRDPKVFWNEEKSKWQMLLAVKDHIQIYESKNLKSWEKLSEFRFNDNPPLGVWECPDLFKLKVEGTEEEKWVLIVSHGGESAPNGGSGTRYFVGDYDGVTFTTEQEKSQWIDYGTDNYAGVTYNNTPDNKRIFIGWMSNWNYANETPTEKWRSAMTLPRELQLIKNGQGYLLKSKLIEAFEDLKNAVDENKISGSFPTNFSYEDLQKSSISLDVSINSELQIMFSNDMGNKYIIGYRKDKGEFFIDRRESGKTDFNKNYSRMSYQTMQIGKREKLAIEIIMDQSSVEIFINNGEYVLTTQVFPEKSFTNFKISPVNDLKINESSIKSIKKAL